MDRDKFRYHSTPELRHVLHLCFWACNTVTGAAVDRAATESATKSYNGKWALRQLQNKLRRKDSCRLGIIIHDFEFEELVYSDYKE